MKKLMMLLLIGIVLAAMFVAADVDVDTSVGGTGDLIVIQAIQTDSGNIDADTVITGNGDIQAALVVDSQNIGDSTTNINSIVYNGDLVFNNEFTDGSNGWINMNIAIDPQYLTVNNNLEGDGTGMDLHYLMNEFMDGADFIIKGKSAVHGMASNEMLNIYTALSRVFVTRSEMDQYYANQLSLHYRLLAIEKTLEKLHPDEFCESKIEVMRDNGLISTSCEDTTYRIEKGTPIGDWVIGIRSIPQPPEPEPINVTPPPEPDNTAKCNQVAIWQGMCNQGMNKWCTIAETNRKAWNCE